MRIPPEELQARRRLRDAERALEDVAPWRVAWQEAGRNLGTRNRKNARGKKGSQHVGKPPHDEIRAKVAGFLARGETHNAAVERTVRTFSGRVSKSHVYRLTRDLPGAPGSRLP